MLKRFLSDFLICILLLALGSACPGQPAPDSEQAVYGLCVAQSTQPNVILQLYVTTGVPGTAGVNTCEIESLSAVGTRGEFRLLARGTSDRVEATWNPDNSECWPVEYRCPGSQCDRDDGTLHYDRGFGLLALHKEGSSLLPVLGWQNDGVVFCEEREGQVCCATRYREDAGPTALDGGATQ